MPLHRIYTTSGQYTPAEKHSLSKAITSLYNQYLPAFYVVVAFIDLPVDSFYIGGEPNSKFVRINVQHLARHFAGVEEKLGFMRLYEEAIKEFTAGKGLDWELNIDEADPLTWHENGMAPPAPGTEAEAAWRASNKALPFEGPTFRDWEPKA
ncbi:hypothetical protein BDV93DRAFT_495739 [Ceratobasidium sp. AG-I]|nr:hypothetical protein BDV93DRAFT_495739 [Ceratobasidium sp. AG-I]